jgi:hypothetical protein
VHRQPESPHEVAGDHRIFHRVVLVGDLALVEPFGVVERQHVGVAVPGVLDVLLPVAVLAG